MPACSSSLWRLRSLWGPSSQRGIRFPMMHQSPAVQPGLGTSAETTSWDDEGSCRLLPKRRQRDATARVARQSPSRRPSAYLQQLPGKKVSPHCCHSNLQHNTSELKCFVIFPAQTTSFSGFQEGGTNIDSSSKKCTKGAEARRKDDVQEPSERLNKPSFIDYKGLTSEVKHCGSQSSDVSLVRVLKWLQLL